MLGKALKTILPENYPYSSPFHTETRRANVFYNSSTVRLSGNDITQTQLCQVAGFVKTFFPFSNFSSLPKNFLLPQTSR
ncbi:hypothetical protein MICAF_140002 [Microcystis aeruginosa PCC 9807]|uniref:Uncharacterized protein n=1 Tax=Microcystis aeruginosa PCC 9807 TaxID=1160283 RepID=I4H0I2_MICAE|nr:hypothetical protein MICAF_140002 [Microcystis aeruginosa PCC 9807]